MKSIILKKAAVVTAAILVTGLIGCGNTKENEQSAEVQETAAGSQETATPEIEELETIDEPEEIEEQATAEPVQKITGRPGNYEYQVSSYDTTQSLIGFNVPEGWEMSSSGMKSEGIHGIHYYLTILKNSDIGGSISIGDFVAYNLHYFTSALVFDTENNTLTLNETQLSDEDDYGKVYLYRNLDAKDSINTVFGTMEIYYYEQETDDTNYNYKVKSSYECGILTIKDSQVIITYSDDSFSGSDYDGEMPDITYQGKLKEIIPQLFEVKQN